MVSWVIVKLAHQTLPKGDISLMSKSITQDMAYRQSLMKYAEKYGVSRALPSTSGIALSLFALCASSPAPCVLRPAPRLAEIALPLPKISFFRNLSKKDYTFLPLRGRTIFFRKKSRKRYFFKVNLRKNGFPSQE